ncbi:winged helix-turn-helix domain-containing protein [Methanolobus sediminis]|uniref:Winged helix-turn-helix domain-containing protein n=1 Tax=Methanolobus sediminis TaxID=3072978 RepID=A0AA51UMJ4_9EURY|nr:winged helix-turn-helix domain-containing protein [Methanolobus sediminis]WMW24740.1 winged helix-turn-helix domain-containing protein [Methanolobus sediminis]
MKLALLGTLFLSDKRKDLLLLLIERPMNIDEIKSTLNVTSSAMMTQIKILIDQGIILYEDDQYQLSSFGEVIVKKMVPLLNTLMVFEDNKQYWENHRVKGIPAHLLESIEELGSCELVEPELNRMYELPKKFTDNLIQSKYIMEISSSFSPAYPYKYIELARKGVRISLIITESVFERLETEYFEQLKDYLGMENTELFVCKEDIGFASSVVTDRFLSLTLFYKNGMFHNHSMMSFETDALKWGEDMYQFFRQTAQEVTGL